MSKRRKSFGAEIEYNNKDINKNNRVIESIKRNLWESASPKLIRGEKGASHLQSLKIP
jgi:hypothetical protein